MKGRPPGTVMTTMGWRAVRPPECAECGERREGQLYTSNPYGQFVCADCASPGDRAVLVERAPADAPDA